MSSAMETLFQQACDVLFAGLAESEDLNINFEAEDSLFIRFNKSKVRQIVDVTQIKVSLFLQIGKKNAEHSLQIPATLFETGEGHEFLNGSLNVLRDEVRQLPDDPFALSMRNNGQSREDMSGDALPGADEFCEQLLGPVAGVDLAGLLVSGTNYVGNRNSKGQRHWFVTRSFYFDYSVYSAKEKAVKGLYADTRFDSGIYAGKIAASLDYLGQMEKPNKVVAPGRYRCYFSPEAIGEIVELMGWNGFSRGALARGNSPMPDLDSGDKSLSPLLSIAEDFSLGLVPSFNALGEPAPERLSLISRGKLVNLLTSSRTAEEYRLESNQANDSEAPRSLTIEPGVLAERDILKTLDTGLYISNLHYLNWSDATKGRITGMTRFACFWVENGEIVSPIQDLRFDETFYNFWGDNLEALTEFAEIQPTVLSYDQRALGGAQVPGMLINNFNFCL
ncbi:MAG: metallopeptidase TldD-related protein [Woeseiaceae bacterium]|jgi:predicted Zn-dependent protease